MYLMYTALNILYEDRNLARLVNIVKGKEQGYKSFKNGDEQV